MSNCDYYEILVENCVVARYVPLEYAKLFVGAIFMEFFHAKDLKVSIRRMNLDTEECNG